MSCLFQLSSTERIPRSLFRLFYALQYYPMIQEVIQTNKQPVQPNTIKSNRRLFHIVELTLYTHVEHFPMVEWCSHKNMATQ